MLTTFWHRFTLFGSSAGDRLVPRSVFSGGQDGLDSGVDHRLLLPVDPDGWRPLGDPVGVDAAGPAAGQEVVMVISADQSQIVRIRQFAVDPPPHVVSFAVLRWVCAAGETPGIPSIVTQPMRVGRCGTL